MHYISAYIVPYYFGFIDRALRELIERITGKIPLRELIEVTLTVIISVLEPTDASSKII